MTCAAKAALIDALDAAATAGELTEAELYAEWRAAMAAAPQPAPTEAEVAAMCAAAGYESVPF